MELAAIIVSLAMLGWSFWGWMREDERRALAQRAARLAASAPTPPASTP
jgi:hypothetical protein